MFHSKLLTCCHQNNSSWMNSESHLTWALIWLIGWCQMTCHHWWHVNWDMKRSHYFAVHSSWDGIKNSRDESVQTETNQPEGNRSTASAPLCNTGECPISLRGHVITVASLECCETGLKSRWVLECVRSSLCAVCNLSLSFKVCLNQVTVTFPCKKLTYSI